jgi:hypothetical protein
MASTVADRSSETAADKSPILVKSMRVCFEARSRGSFRRVVDGWGSLETGPQSKLASTSREWGSCLRLFRMV